MMLLGLGRFVSSSPLLFIELLLSSFLPLGAAMRWLFVFTFAEGGSCLF